MSDQIAKHITKGGPGDRYLGGGKVDTSSWFYEFPLLEDQIRNQDIFINNVIQSLPGRSFSQFSYIVEKKGNSFS